MPKVILLTGATDGIGLGAARKFAMDGHRLLLHGRNQQKLLQIQSNLTSEAKDLESIIKTFCTDLSDLSQVDQMASEVSQYCNENQLTIDVIINNAGVLKTANSVTPSGLDIRFVVNTLAPMLLTQKLLPQLSNDGRIINLSSAAQARIDFELLNGNRQTNDDLNAYSQSKLAITQWTAYLANTLQNEQSAIALNPGSLLGSKMVKEGFGISGKDINIGADIIFRLACDIDIHNHNGGYFDNDGGDWGRPHQDVLNMSKNEKLVQYLNKIIDSELIEPHRFKL